MRKFFVLGLAFLSFGYRLSGQERLLPAPSVFDDVIYEYTHEVRRILIGEGRGEASLRFLVIPSFQPEYVFEIVGSEIVYKQPASSIWYTGKFGMGEYDPKKGLSIGVETHRIKIVNGIPSLFRLFRAAVLASQFPENDHMMGLDGATYYFSIVEKGWITGSIWSPRNGSNTHELVEICGALVSLIKEADGELTLPAELLARMDSLAEIFEGLRK